MKQPKNEDQGKKRQPKQKGRKYEPPVSLWGLTFDEAVTMIATAKPKKGSKKRKA